MTIPLLHRDPLNQWLDAFLDEWLRLAEGNADPHQVLDLAGELYDQNPNRDPVEVAREAWDASE
ncbi:hypothetical protein LJR084_001949 [Variovorax sp. LjRoot84]|uniref:hypothetical protein n=1 Tax=Variovorax sp. LjRoot84 TaxID=3342340 RepID=UPI003ECD7D00